MSLKENDLENPDSPNNIARRQQEKVEKQKQLDADFESNGYIELVSDILEPLKNEKLVTEKDIKRITDRLKTNYKGEEKGFDLNNELKKVIFGFIFEKVEMKNNLKEYKKAKIEYSQKVWEKIKNNEGIVKKGQENNQKTVEISKTTKETVDNTRKETKNILEKPEENTNSQTAKDKIQSRLGLNDEEINEKLNTKSEREKNLKNAKEIFFTQEKISEYTQSSETQLDDKNPLKNFGETIFKEGEIIDKDLENILGNFVINNGEENLKTYSSNNIGIIDEALNDAFEIEIEKLLKGKNKDNYNSDAIEEIKNNILDDNITKNPLEKLQKFKELKLSLQTSIASKFSKTNKLLKEGNSKELKSEKNRLAKLYNNLKQNLEKIYIKPSENKILKEILENYKKIDEKIKGGDVMQGGKLDKTKTGVEKNLQES